jgi:6-phosphogluconolactonase
MKQLVTSKNSDELDQLAARKIIEIAARAVEQSGRFTLALSGGSTPRSLYQLLASEPYRKRIAWDKAHFFFGDERLVAADSPESNYRMAKVAFLEPLKIPEGRIYRWKTELSEPKAIAADYENQLRAFTKGSLPKFDLVLLGLGPDGHTASLFPFTQALQEAERDAVANWVPKLDAWRLTLTFPVLNNAANVVFLVSGDDKASILRAVLEGPFDPDRLPAQMIQPFHGDLFWLIDRAASRELQNAEFTIHN